jgi:hypothetical protein
MLCWIIDVENMIGAGQFREADNPECNRLMSFAVLPFACHVTELCTLPQGCSPILCPSSSVLGSGIKTNPSRRF